MGALKRIGTRQPPAKQEAVAHGRQYLTFVVTAETFGIAIASIKEIIEYRTPTEVPMLPRYMRGIINLRGRVVPVIDLAARFGRSRLEQTRRTCIVILEVIENEEQHDVGVMVDAVSAVVEIADADVEPPPLFGANLRAEFISGMGKLGEQFVILLDIGKVLSIEELAIPEAMGEGQAAVGEAHAPRSAAPQAIAMPAP
ncbi:MAG TPA: chemotaxis protein CheW [Casimicrobiaceae bacterium]